MNTPRVETIFVGTELLTGKINTHIGYLGRVLPELGFKIAREHTVGDDPDLMKECFTDAFRRSDVVLCFGGLGPTFDDITRDAWSDILRRPLKRNELLLKDIQNKFRKRGLAMPPANARQAELIQGAVAMKNQNGTAPGQWILRNQKLVALLPGPSREMIPMFESELRPVLLKKWGRRIIQSKTFLLVGIAESQVDQIIRPFVEKNSSMLGCSIVHGILASQSIVSVKFSVEGSRRDRVENVVKNLSREVRTLLGNSVFGEDKDTLESVIGAHLKKNHETLSVAESCTGGWISKSITDQSGASDYFKEGLVTYHNASKMRLLGVKSQTLAKHGAVSEFTAQEMAEGVRRKAKTTYGLSVTGIAGPTGGSKAKPVGLVYVGCAGPRGTRVKEFRFSGDRAWIRHRATLMALDLLRRELIH